MRKNAVEPALETRGNIVKVSSPDSLHHVPPRKMPEGLQGKKRKRSKPRPASYV